MSKLKYKIGDQVEVYCEHAQYCGIIIDAEARPEEVYRVNAYGPGGDEWVHEYDIVRLIKTHEELNPQYTMHEQRRYEVAKELYQRCLEAQTRNEFMPGVHVSNEVKKNLTAEAAKYAIFLADVFLSELEEGGEE